MKQIKLISILAILFFTFTQFKIETEWKSLNKEKYSIEYPSNWDLSQSGQAGTDFILFSKLESETDNFRENVNLIIQDLSGLKIDMNKFVEISEKQVKTLITKPNIIESKRINTGNLSYHKMIYTGEMGVLKLKFEQYFFIQKEKAYIITLTCSQSSFKNYKKIGEKILNSFTLK